MKQFKFIISISLSLSLGITSYVSAQGSEDSELFQTLKTKDSLLFNVGFNACDINQFQNLTTDDLEFYHDKTGIQNTKEVFISAITSGICNKDNPNKSRRELVEGSLKVFPLYNNGELYGAIQNGEHKFYERLEGQEKAGSTAKFSHLWILENNQWKIKRVYSFDHQL